MTDSAYSPFDDVVAAVAAREVQRFATLLAGEIERLETRVDGNLKRKDFYEALLDAAVRYSQGERRYSQGEIA